MTGSEKQEFALLLYDTNARINKEKIEILEEEIQSLKTGIINLEQYDNLNGKDKQKQANEFLGTILTNAELIKPFLETTDKTILIPKEPNYLNYFLVNSFCEINRVSNHQS